MLGRPRGLNDHRPESSLVGPIAVEDAGAFEPLAGSLVDPATAVDELGDMEMSPTCADEQRSCDWTALGNRYNSLLSR